MSTTNDNPAIWGVFAGEPKQVDVDFWVRSIAASGFYCLHEVAARVAERLSAVCQPLVPEDEREFWLSIEQEVIAAWKRLRAEQHFWPPITTYDRLQAAVAGMNDRDVLAAINVGCCSGCGQHQAVELMLARRTPCLGYVFCSQEDIQAAVLGQGLWLTIGAIPVFNAEAASQETLIQEALGPVRAVVLEELAAAGLTAECDPGGQKVHLDMPWQKRVPDWPWVGPWPTES